MRDNIFCGMEELDAIAQSPFILQPSISLSTTVVNVIERFGIMRDLSCNYTCHWKDKLISADLIDSTTLMFQEDDAFICSILVYPDPIPDWSVWQTIYFYSTKLYTSISSKALALYRGETKNRETSTSGGINSVICEGNQPSCSLRNLNSPISTWIELWKRGEAPGGNSFSH